MGRPFQLMQAQRIASETPRKMGFYPTEITAPELRAGREGKKLDEIAGNASQILENRSVCLQT
jgi:hypothetical protein